MAFWSNLWGVGRWCLLASVALFLAVGAWIGQPWAWVVATLPVVVLVVWMRLVVRQARRHSRGEAGPPPGWVGRL